MYTDIQIVNAAVAKLGDVPIAAIPPRNWETRGIFLQNNDGEFVDLQGNVLANQNQPVTDPQYTIEAQQFTEAAQVCGATYWIHRDALLAAYPWSWAVKRTKLVGQGTTDPDNPPRYKYLYWLPGDAGLGVGIRAVYTTAEGRRPIVDGWTREERGISSWRKELWADYIPDPTHESSQRFPPSFVNALMLRLCAEWAFYFTDQANLTQYYRGLSEEAFMEAKRLDAQAKPSVEIEDHPFLDARYRGSANTRAYRTG